MDLLIVRDDVMHVNSKHIAVQACLLALVCIIPCGGCASVASFQDWHFSCCNKYRASEAWKCSYSYDQRRNCSADFEAGFKRGYYDTAMNRDCRLPPVAPPKYWAARYQSCEGQQLVHDWFRGYEIGIASAQSGSCPNFAEVPVSPNAPTTNKTGCGTCYSPDKCKCGSQPCGTDPHGGDVMDWSPSYYQPHAEESGEHQSHGAMLDLPSSKAIIPASYGGGGLIGGFGSK